MVMKPIGTSYSRQKSVIIFVSIILLLNVKVEFCNAERIPEPRLDRPYWTSPLQNQTIEYGTRFHYQVNISQPIPAFRWFISDTENFRIDGGPFSAVIRDNAPLAIGTYILGISIWDYEYSNLQAWIIISVIDSLSPLISSPEDINITRGSEGNILTWELYDLNPGRYQVFRSGVLLESVKWIESEITVEVVLDFISVGTYNYKISASDIGGNIATDVVKVEVHENDTLDPPTHHPDVIAAQKPFGGFGKYVAPRLVLPVMELFAAIVLLGLAAVVAVAVLAERDREWGFE